MTYSHRPIQAKHRWIIWAHLAWLGMICLLAGWWARLLLDQSARIHALELQMGGARGAIEQFERTQRMLFWESTTFFVLLIFSIAAFLWIYVRDLKRNRALEGFFASVTHELRTPLTSIRLQAEAISDFADQKQEKLVRRLLEDTQRMESQVERTLELARIEGGGDLFRRSVHLHSWLERFTEEYRMVHGNRLEVTLDVTDAVIQADTGALAIIFRNLFENSLRHSQKDKVRIRIYCRSGKDRRLTFCIEDDGGPVQLPKQLGELFVKGSQSQGSGVGLYLVQELMRKMQGSSRFQSSHSGFVTHLTFDGGAHG